MWYFMHEWKEGERGVGRREGGPGGPDTKPLLSMAVMSSSPQWTVKFSYQSNCPSNRKVEQCHWIKPEGVNDVSPNIKSRKVAKMQWNFTLTRILIVINSWRLSTYNHTSIGWFFFPKSVQTSETSGIFCSGVGVPAFVLKVESRGKTAPISL